MNTLMETLATNHEHVAQWTALLVQENLWHKLWQPTHTPNSFKIGLLLTAHVMALNPLTEDAEEVASSIENIWCIRDTLATNAPVCEALEALWTDTPSIATQISSDTLLMLSSNLHGIHPNIVNPGYRKFLQMKLDPLPSDSDPTADPAYIRTISRQFVDLVNAVKHLDLDAGHWHELWEEGESIGLCIILHYIKHEKRSRLENLGRIRNVNACINSNVKKIRDGLAAAPGIVDELIHLWKQRPDISGHLDGNTLSLLVSERQSNLLTVRRCFAQLCRKLPGTWANSCGGTAENPSAYLYTCVSNFISSKAGSRPGKAQQPPQRARIPADQQAHILISAITADNQTGEHSGKCPGAGLKARSPAASNSSSPDSSRASSPDSRPLAKSPDRSRVLNPDKKRDLQNQLSPTSPQTPPSYMSRDTMPSLFSRASPSVVQPTLSVVQTSTHDRPQGRLVGTPFLSAPAVEVPVQKVDSMLLTDQIALKDTSQILIDQSAVETIMPSQILLEQMSSSQPSTPVQISESKITSFLSLGSTQSSEEMLESVHSLTPGHISPMQLTEWSQECDGQMWPQGNDMPHTWPQERDTQGWAQAGDDGQGWLRDNDGQGWCQGDLWNRQGLAGGYCLPPQSQAAGLTHDLYQDVMQAQCGVMPLRIQGQSSSGWWAEGMVACA